MPRAQAGIGLPGPNTAATPAASSAGTSAGGTTPPTVTRMSGRPSSRSASMSSGHQQPVSAGQARRADDVHVVVDRHLRRFARRLEQRPDVDVEAEVGEGGGDDAGAAIVAVLPQLDDQDARPAAVVLDEGRGPGAGPGVVVVPGPAFGCPAFGGPAFGRIHAGARSRRRLIAPEDDFERRRDLAERGARPGGVDRQREQVAAISAGARLGAARQRRQRARDRGGVARRRAPSPAAPPARPAPRRRPPGARRWPGSPRGRSG